MSSVDKVSDAATTPGVEQPWAELGLKGDEYQRIRDILGRRPTSAELAMYSVMWSEHCSYKSSKVHLRTFGDLPRSEALLVGMGPHVVPDDRQVPEIVGALGVDLLGAHLVVAAPIEGGGRQ